MRVHAVSRLPLPAEISPEEDEEIERSIRLANPARTDRVSVAGPAGLDALIRLCRDGSEPVECARQATCSSADELSDVPFDHRTHDGTAARSSCA
jgi:hypothetical protein